MILLPYGHEQTTVRRLPWVTLGLMALCAAAFVFSGRWHPVSGEDDRIQEDALAALQWYAEHPYLKLDPTFEETFLSGAGAEASKEMFGLLAQAQPAVPPPSARQVEQEHLDTLMSRAVAGLQDHSLRRFGLVPAEPSPAAWLTHMFLHAGWLHLLGNMLILFLAGPFIEDVWGRPIYLAFYVASGLAAAGCHVLSDTASTAPMIGASGAIAGVMGAFLIRHGRTKIKFFYLFLLARGTFLAPAWLMIPLWFVSQVWLGLLTSELQVNAGVAYWAHIGGFAAGVAAAWFMASQRIEARFIQPAIESKLTLEVAENRGVIEAFAVGDSDPDRAFRMLAMAVLEQPRNHDAAAALWELAQSSGRMEEAASLMLRSAAEQLRSGDRELALEQWVAVQRQLPGFRGEPRLLARLGQALVAQGWEQDARVTLRLALQSSDGQAGPTLALSIARSAREIDPETAEAAATRALALAGPDPETRRQAEEILAGLPRTRPVLVVHSPEA